MDWLETLAGLVASSNLAIFRFSDDEWARIADSLRSWHRISPFTIARSHSLLDRFSVPTVGLLFGEGPVGTEAFLGLVKSKHAVSTLESRVKVVSVFPISISTEHDLLQLVTKRGFKTKLRSSLRLKESVVSLGSELSVHLIERLAASEGNHDAMRSVVSALSSPKTYSSNSALQQDAISLALKAFGISPTESAILVETTGDRETALARVDHVGNGSVKIREDAVIEHDARNVPRIHFRRK